MIIILIYILYTLFLIIYFLLMFTLPMLSTMRAATNPFIKFVYQKLTSVFIKFTHWIITPNKNADKYKMLFSVCVCGVFYPSVNENFDVSFSIGIEFPCEQKTCWYQKIIEEEIEVPNEDGNPDSPPQKKKIKRTELVEGTCPSDYLKFKRVLFCFWEDEPKKPKK